MTEETPMERFLNEMAKLLKTTQEKIDYLNKDEARAQESVPDEVIGKLFEFQQALDLFITMNKCFIPETEEGKKKLEEVIKQPEELPEEERMTLEKVGFLRQNVEKARKDLLVSLALLKSKNLLKEIEGKKRRKKFRGFNDIKRKRI